MLVDLANRRLDFLDLALAHEVDLVQQHAICKRYLVNGLVHRPVGLFLVEVL